MRSFAFTCAALLVFASAVLITNLPASLVGDSVAARRDRVALIWPMTWQFYLDPAGREFTVAYRPGRDGSFVALVYPASAAQYQWGLDRRSYGDLIRLVSTARGISPDQWRDCAAARISECAAVIESAPRSAIPSRFETGQVCGLTVFALERPGNWRESSNRQIVRVAVVNLTC